MVPVVASIVIPEVAEYVPPAVPVLVTGNEVFELQTVLPL
jgi:molybdopterin biosynthesis enzyme